MESSAVIAVAITPDRLKSIYCSHFHLFLLKCCINNTTCCLDEGNKKHITPIDDNALLGYNVTKPALYKTR